MTSAPPDFESLTFDLICAPAWGERRRMLRSWMRRWPRLADRLLDFALGLAALEALERAEIPDA